MTQTKKPAESGGKTTNKPAATEAPTDAATGYVVDSGPQTTVEAPADQPRDRYPSTVMAPSKSGPLTPPKDSKTQTVPKTGIPASSTDHVHAAVGGRTFAGESYTGLVDDDGKALKPSAVFDDDPSKTTVTAKTTVWEEFTYPNTRTKGRRRLYGEGVTVPRAEAARFLAATDAEK